MIGAPAGFGAEDTQLDAALLGELEGVGQEVLQDLLQPLGVGDDGVAKVRIDLDFERQMARVGLVPEDAADGFEEVDEADAVGLDRHRTGLDLGKIEDVGDQVHEVGARGVDGAGEIDLFGAEGCRPGLSPSCWPRMRMLFSGVLSS